MSNIPIVTAEKLLQYKQDYGHIGAFKAPETILVCYQSSTIRYLLKKHPEFQPSEAVTHLYVRENRQAGILGDWGVGAPGLSIKMEELVAIVQLDKSFSRNFERESSTRIDDHRLRNLIRINVIRI